VRLLKIQSGGSNNCGKLSKNPGPFLRGKGFGGLGNVLFLSFLENPTTPLGIGGGCIHETSSRGD